MENITGKTEYATSLALGYFDGFHLGHRAIAEAALAGPGRAVVVTFRFNGVRLEAKGGGDLICPKQKRDFFEKAGFFGWLENDFESIRHLTAREYVREILAPLSPAFVVCGEDYRFGCDRAGTGELQSLCDEIGAKTEILPRLRLGGELSTTEIKRLLADGEVEAARQLLGHEYTLEGVIVHGDERGRTLGFPTVNQHLSGLFVPRHGVYASSTEIDGRRYDSITNIGQRPTFYGEGEPLAETHLIGFSGDAYGKTARVTLLGFIRPERHFDSGDELAEAIHGDLESAENFWSRSL